MSRTIKPLSSISYNTRDFLKNKLDDLSKRGVLDFWCFIFHHGEHMEDGSQEKDHFHVSMVPGEQVDKTPKIKHTTFT